jgi:hypothetical protein
MNAAEYERIIVDGLAAHAISGFEFGTPLEDTRAMLIAKWTQFGAPRGAFAAAAAAIAHFPQPVDETAEELEQARPIRNLLGVTSADDQLLAALRARELLGELAAELG